ncbi:MAG: hypothetical protein KDA61_05255, partial [Planctomycetales bacterium]|nr:hypothetical protein [Planctomycetales bacterium]
MRRTLKYQPTLSPLILTAFAAACLGVPLALAEAPSHADAKSETAATPEAQSAILSEELALIEHPIAVLPFRERGKEVEEMGGQVADLVYARLVVDPTLTLVDREDLDKSLDEAELNLSGVVHPGQAIAIGQLTGAQLLVTGSVFQIDNSVYLVAKVIGSETSRVLGASVKGRAGDELDE